MNVKRAPDKLSLFYFPMLLTKFFLQTVSFADGFSWSHESIKSCFQTEIACQLLRSLLLLRSANRAFPRNSCHSCQTFLAKGVSTRGHPEGRLEKISTYWTFKLLFHFWIFQKIFSFVWSRQSEFSRLSKKVNNDFDLCCISYASKSDFMVTKIVWANNLGPFVMSNFWQFCQRGNFLLFPTPGSSKLMTLNSG